MNRVLVVGVVHGRGRQEDEALFAWVGEGEGERGKSGCVRGLRRF